ncbi:hypothetical protein F511_38518 [Dorcoceras hygrometricum]|uniref:Uncharacterized protein n=1 Tax=Dorcoceras hygrometricum TaxID=472368 RepID=A0A2Z7CQF8_9LAMI|nr:hypothetical protein F511_38518 [Dorcoceras hygrometricum]
MGRSSWNISCARGLVVMLIVVACTTHMELVHPVEGQIVRVGQCLVGCGQRTVVCSINCLIRGGGLLRAIPCFQNCGSDDVACVTTCLGPQFHPKVECH